MDMAGLLDDTTLSSGDPPLNQTAIESAPTHDIRHDYCSSDHCGMHEEHRSTLYVKEESTWKETPNFTTPPCNMSRQLPYEESDGSFYGGTMSSEQYRYDEEFTRMFEQSRPSQMLESEGGDSLFDDVEWEGLTHCDWLEHVQNTALSNKTAANAANATSSEKTAGLDATTDGGTNADSEAADLMGYRVQVHDGNTRLVTDERYLLNDVLTKDGRDAGLAAEKAALAAKAPTLGPTLSEEEELDVDSSWIDITWDSSTVEEPGSLGGDSQPVNPSRQKIPTWRQLDTSNEPPLLFDRKPEPTISSGSFCSEDILQGQETPITRPKSPESVVPATFSGSPHNTTFQDSNVFVCAITGRYIEVTGDARDLVAAETFDSPCHRLVERVGYYDALDDSIGASDTASNFEGAAARSGMNPVDKKRRPLSPEEYRRMVGNPAVDLGNSPQMLTSPPGQLYSTIKHRPQSTLTSSSQENEPSLEPQHQHSVVKVESQQVLAPLPVGDNPLPAHHQGNTASNEADIKHALANINAQMLLSDQASAQFSANHRAYLERLASVRRESDTAGATAEGAVLPLYAQLLEAAGADESLSNSSRADAQITAGKLPMKSVRRKGGVKKRTSRREDNEKAFKPTDSSSSSDDLKPTPKRQKNNSGVKGKGVKKHRGSGKDEAVNLNSSPDVVMEDIGDDDKAEQLNKAKADEATIDTVHVKYIERAGLHEASNVPLGNRATLLFRKSSAMFRLVESDDLEQEIIVDAEDPCPSVENSHGRNEVDATFHKNRTSSLSSVHEDDSQETPASTANSKPESIAANKPPPKVTRSKTKPAVAAALEYFQESTKCTGAASRSSKKGDGKFEGGTGSKRKKGDDINKNTTTPSAAKTKKHPANKKGPASVSLPKQEVRETRGASLKRQEMEEKTAWEQDISKRLRSKDSRK